MNLPKRKEYLCHYNKLRSALAISICLFALFSEGTIAGERTPTTSSSVSVEELIDVSATTIIEMFRFEPALVRIPVDGTVRFIHIAGTHKAVSVEGMLPEGVESIRLPFMRTAKVGFDRPGIYGFKCSIHGRHGMVMIVAVGDHWPNFDRAQAAMPSGSPGEKFRQLFAQLKKVQPTQSR